MSIHPMNLSNGGDILKFGLGGFGWSVHELEWHDPVLDYVTYENGFSDLARRTGYHPGAAEWAGFWSEVERIGVWSWKADYINPNVLDGTQWDLHLRHGANELRTTGSNEFPGGQDGTYSPECAFGRFVSALRHLTGGQGLPGLR